MSRTSAAVSPRELSARALATGLLLGALLAPSNVYSGLKIGWSFNMSIIALLVGFAFWRESPGIRAPALVVAGEQHQVLRGLWGRAS